MFVVFRVRFGSSFNFFVLLFIVSESSVELCSESNFFGVCFSFFVVVVRGIFG